MAIKRKDFQKTSSTILEFLLKLPDEEASSRLRDTLLHALHFLQQYYLILQKRDKEQKPLQWTIERGLSPLTPFREAPDKFQWPWIDVESNKVKQIIPKHSLNNFINLSPIIIAVREGDLRYVKELLNIEPDLIECVDSFGRDLLTYSVQYQQINILNYLLDEYKSIININIQANDGSTCLHRACYTDNGQYINIEIIKILLENNADVKKQDVHLRSPLHWAVLAENIDCLKLLIEYNADIHMKDIDGMTPAMWACHLDRYEHFKELSNYMNNIIEKDNDGRTWIHHSARKTEPLECLKYLLSSESILLRDNDGRTCLHVAAEQGSVHACRLIFQMIEQTNNYSYIHDGDKYRQTPLHLATKHGHARVLKELLDHGADPHLKDIHGISSLDYAQNRGLYFCRSVFEVYLREKTNNNNNNINSRPSTTLSFNNNSRIKINGYDVTPIPPGNGHATYIRRNSRRHLNESLPIETHSSPNLSIEKYSRTINYSNQQDNNNNEKDFNRSLSSSTITTNPPPIKPRKSSIKLNNLSNIQKHHNHIIINSTHSEDDDQSDANSLAGHGSDDNDDYLLEYEKSNSRLLLRHNDERFQQQTNKNSMYDDYRFLDDQQQLSSRNKSKQKIRKTTVNKDFSHSPSNHINSNNGNLSISNRLKSSSKSSSTESIPTLDLTVAGQKVFRIKQQSDTYFTNCLPSSSSSNVMRPPSGRLKPINSAKSTSSYTDELSSISNKTLEDVTNNVKQLSSPKTHLYKKKLAPLLNGNDAIIKKYSYRSTIDQQQHIVEDISSDRSEETSATASINGASQDMKSSNISEKRSKYH
ncbi:unnamed protein product [Rotaria sp. Silwood1]|nr:unnamed protein product [Rotaria sp. Silwood1]CAF1521867.1 unnamed protein product [Rotaria sp. Silwood1]CAF3615242.1 unnamed protein product [Rotaria sp. Silwood1]CAF3721758.1 unnamed protein product [Rotaria sp. Silwood1]CAF4759096.1 unnamed protein product [Rotaria sp. Silwood1]